MDVQRSLIWDLRKQIYFMNEKNMGLRKDDIYCLKGGGKYDFVARLVSIFEHDNCKNYPKFYPI